MKEIVMQLEDERRTVDQYKEQVEKVCVAKRKTTTMSTMS